MNAQNGSHHARQLAACVVYAAALGIAGAAIMQARQQGAPQATFKSRVDAVRIDALVTDRGKPVIGLTADDFEVLDNGVPQKCVLAPDAGQVSVIQVLDTSSSVQGTQLRELREAASGVLEFLQPADRAALLTFSERIVLDAPLRARGNDDAGLKAAVSRVQAGGRTALNDAIFAGVSLPGPSAGRSLVILFSDGADTASWLTRTAVLEAAKRTEVVLYVVATGLDRAPSRDPNRAATVSAAILQAQQAQQEAGGREREEFLQSVADATGGQLFRTGPGSRLKPRFAAILDEFRSRYLISYTPEGVAQDGAWHTLKVRLKSKAGTVKARGGYYAKKP